jgi:hydrogenase maturation protease
MKPSLLVLGIGNPSRGDDALGPAFVERAAGIAGEDVELLTDFQLQIEHALDLEGRRGVLFVDASTIAKAPFELVRITAKDDRSHTTHAMTPEAVLGTYERVVGDPPEAWLLAIRGERFELGDPLSDEARANLDAALAFFATYAMRARTSSADAFAPNR